MSRDNRDITPDKLIRTQERARLDELAAATEPAYVTDSNGAIASLRERDGQTLVVLTYPDGRDMGWGNEVGISFERGFVPALGVPFHLSAETLRAIATLIETEG